MSKCSQSKVFVYISYCNVQGTVASNITTVQQSNRCNKNNTNTAQYHCKHSERAAVSNSSLSAHNVSCAGNAFQIYKHIKSAIQYFLNICKHLYDVAFTVHQRMAIKITAKYVPNARVSAGGEVAVHLPWKARIFVHHFIGRLKKSWVELRRASN